MKLINNLKNQSNTGIYLVYSIKSEDICYVGSSSNIVSRYTKHKCLLKNGNHFRKELQEISTNFGFENMRFEILELCDSDVLEDREQYHFNERAKSAVNRRIFIDSNKGLKYPKESIERARQSRIKSGFIPFSNVDRSKRAGVNHHYYGKERSEETKRKISESNKGKIGNYPVSQYSLDGIFIKTFTSATVASKEIGCSDKNIRSAANPICRQKTAGGFIWKR